MSDQQCVMSEQRHSCPDICPGNKILLFRALVCGGRSKLKSVVSLNTSMFTDDPLYKEFSRIIWDEWHQCLDLCSHFCADSSITRECHAFHGNQTSSRGQYHIVLQVVMRTSPPPYVHSFVKCILMLLLWGLCNWRGCNYILLSGRCI